jgi:hypothetical protein
LFQCVLADPQDFGPVIAAAKSQGQTYKHWRALGGGELGVLSSFLERRTCRSVYSVKGKGWRYDFTLIKTCYTSNWFKTKSEARRAEAKK